MTTNQINGYDDFSVGQVFEHWPRKTILESDNNLFCLLTLNQHPVHSDRIYAQESRHGRILVVGTYIISLVVGMSVRDISMGAIANLGYRNIHHIGPVFVGDTISAKTEVLSKVFREGGSTGVVRVRTSAFNQVDNRVLELERDVLFNIPVAVK